MRLGAAAIDYSSWSAADLDDAYATAYAAGDSATYTAIADQIVINEAAPFTGFVQNLFGTPYPKYDAIQTSIGNFAGSTAAPAAVATSANNLETNVVNAASSIGSGAVVVMGSAAIIALLIFLRKK